MTTTTGSRSSGSSDARQRRAVNLVGGLEAGVRRSSVLAATLAVSAVGILVAGIVAYRFATAGGLRILAIELGGSAGAVQQVVAGHAGDYEHALYVDFGLMAAYGLAITVGALLGRWLSYTKGARRLAQLALLAVPFVVLCDIGENLTLLPLVRGSTSNDGYAIAAQAFAVTKFVLLAPAALVAAVAVVTTCCRAVRKPVEVNLRHARSPVADEYPTSAGEASGSPGVVHAVWRANTLSAVSPCADGEAAAMGICVSGGGIRSATFTLGALDALRDVLHGARYLVSVSGGGYAAGAMQLAMQGAHRAGRNLDGGRVPHLGDVYAGGSPELDHTRKHGKYLADSAREWVVALGTVLRGVVVNVLLLGVVTVVVGRVLAHAYAATPLPRLGGDAWPPPKGVSWAVGVLVAVGVVTWVTTVLFEPHWAPRRLTHDGLRGGRLRRSLRALSRGAFTVGLLVALAGAGLPLLAWAAHTPPPGAVGISAPSVAVIAGYVAALVAASKRPAAKGAVGAVRRWLTTAGPRERSLAANLVVWVVLLAMSGAFLLLFGEALATTGKVSATSTWPGHFAEWTTTVVAVAVLAFFMFADQVRWSLHPFYKRRLATAFAVRRVRTGGGVRAERYDFDAEPTFLHEYDEWRAPDGRRDHPQVIFSCAAHVSDPEITPPGRRVLPFTLSADYVGSPAVGWVGSEDLHAALERSPLLQLDLTVQAAQAISGAAISSQMGRAQAAYTRLLTLTNVRLGSWLPNPAYLIRLSKDPQWWLPRIPRRRYLITLLRELVGQFPADSPLLYVSDGGHYENLGLVELLRRRPHYVYCLDGSGDRGDVPRTLAQAIELAYEELGVTVVMDHPADLGAGPDGPHPAAPDQLLGELADRLAPSCVATGRIVYPDLGPGLPPAVGRLVIGKAALTRETPFDVLTHATSHPSFPNDSTADQWFDFERFDAYHALGRYVGAQVAGVLPPRAAQVPEPRQARIGGAAVHPPG